MGACRYHHAFILIIDCFMWLNPGTVGMIMPSVRAPRAWHFCDVAPRKADLLAETLVTDSAMLVESRENQEAAMISWTRLVRTPGCLPVAHARVPPAGAARPSPSGRAVRPAAKPATPGGCAGAVQGRRVRPPSVGDRALAQLRVFTDDSAPTRNQGSVCVSCPV